MFFTSFYFFQTLYQKKGGVQFKIRKTKVIGKYFNTEEMNITISSTIGAAESAESVLPELSHSQQPPTTTTATVEILNIYRTLLYIILIVLGVLLNQIVIVTILRGRKFQHTKNFFLLNIATSDMLVGIVCIPLTLVYGSLFGRNDIIIGAAVHTLSPNLQSSMDFLQGVIMTSSVYSFCMISIERYAYTQTYIYLWVYAFLLNSGRFV